MKNTGKETKGCKPTNNRLVIYCQNAVSPQVTRVPKGKEKQKPTVTVPPSLAYVLCPEEGWKGFASMLQNYQHLLCLCTPYISNIGRLLDRYTVQAQFNESILNYKQNPHIDP